MPRKEERESDAAKRGEWDGSSEMTAWAVRLCVAGLGMRSAEKRSKIYSAADH